LTSEPPRTEHLQATERAAARFGPALTETIAVVVEGPDQGREFPVTAELIRVGKADTNDIILQDPAVSSHHLEITLVGAAVRVRDLGSTNGTWVAQARLSESLVPPGTVLQLGRTKIHLQTPDSSFVLEPADVDHFGELWGASVAMRQLYAVLQRVAPRDATVLLDGETGTGKELAARAIHEHSTRKHGPFAVFDCSSAAAELIESQLFGHRKGAFTGATSDRMGVFEAAAGGTLFLDELDSLPLELQPKLLRVLEGRRVVRLGEFRERPVDVRIIAAAGRSPEEAAAAGDLRPDLYYRLAVVRVTLPGLRDRIDDIPLLVRVLLDRMGGQGIEVSAGRGLSRLCAHPWMGNVRELRNVLERALALAPTGAACLDDLPLQMSGGPSVTRDELAPVRRDPLHEGLPYKEAKERIVEVWEARYLEAAFDRNDGNLSKTGRQIGLSRPHLRKLLRLHGLIDGGGGE
jgi:DNA-binding NtrC family response regulator